MAGSQYDQRPELRGLRCVRCGVATALRYDTDGCVACRGQGVPSALLADYDLSGVDGERLWSQWSHRMPGLWSYRELLAVDADQAVSLHEGATPLIELPRKATGVANRVFAKDERRNPTGSFKDRFYSTAVSWAADAGASTVAIASSGNAGVSAAAYAAAAGLDCVVVATGDLQPTWRRLIELHGGHLVIASDHDHRWQILREQAQKEDWTVLTNTSTVPVSSLWVGIGGYKTIAYELVRDLGAGPDVVVAPVSRGDGLAGIWLGFRELRELGVIDRVPAMVAAERYPSLTHTLDQDSDLPTFETVDPHNAATSIGDPRATVMSLCAIKESGGTAVVRSDAALRDAAHRLGGAGIGAELSSAAGLAATEELGRGGWLDPDATVVNLITSHAANQPSALA